MIKKITKAILNRTDQWRPPVMLKKGGSGYALLSYIISPFRGNGPVYHSSAVEAAQMADVLNELGYSVDGVDYRYKGKIDYSKYDLVIGFGIPFRHSFVPLQKEVKRICYLTGASPEFSNMAEARRVRDLYKRNGIRVSPKREVYWPWVFGAVNADALMLIGNDWTRSTYQSVNDKIFTLPVPFIAHSRPVSARSDNANGFVWFSGPGAVHKGLDLVLDALSLDTDDLRLDICGNISKEEDFFNSYRSKIFDDPRVRFMGMIRPDSEPMNEVISRNAFVLLPSCSEGTASSVITCMASGLIPLVTKETGVNLCGFGIEISDASPESVRQAMKKAAAMPVEEMLRQRKTVAEYVMQHHSPAAFKQQFSEALLHVIERK